MKEDKSGCLSANSLCSRVRCHIVHLSSAEPLRLIQEARQAGAPLTVETTHHYLSLCAENIPAGATQFKCCPPIRGSVNQVNRIRCTTDGSSVWASAFKLEIIWSPVDAWFCPHRSSYGPRWKLGRLTWWCLIIPPAPLTSRNWIVETSPKRGGGFLLYNLVITDKRRQLQKHSLHSTINVCLTSDISSITMHRPTPSSHLPVRMPSRRKH